MLHYFTPASQIPVPGMKQFWKMLQYFVGHHCGVLPVAESGAQLCSRGVGVLLLGACCEVGGGQSEGPPSIGFHTCGTSVSIRAYPQVVSPAGRLLVL